MPDSACSFGYPQSHTGSIPTTNLYQLHRRLLINPPHGWHPCTVCGRISNAEFSVQHFICPRSSVHQSPTACSPHSACPPASPHLTPMALVTLRSANAGDVRCISWILWNITDPEALDAAVRLAGAVRWFEDGLDVEPPYDQIITTLRGCFDSTRKVYPGSRDRAYYSAQAALWIHVRALLYLRVFKEVPSPNH
jgi:hypothetical protein